MANVKETFKKNDTQADVNLLHAMKKLPGQSVNDYKNALLEAGTRIMLAENYTESQIKDQLKIIFIANVQFLTLPDYAEEELVIIHPSPNKELRIFALTPYLFIL